MYFGSFSEFMSRSVSLDCNLMPSIFNDCHSVAAAPYNMTVTWKRSACIEVAKLPLIQLSGLL